MGATCRFNRSHVKAHGIGVRVGVCLQVVLEKHLESVELHHLVIGDAVPRKPAPQFWQTAFLPETWQIQASLEYVLPLILCLAGQRRIQRNAFTMFHENCRIGAFCCHEHIGHSTFHLGEAAGAKRSVVQAVDES